jgi:cellulose synthase operon protein C
MKKLLLILLPLLVIGMLGGAVWWKYGRARNPLAAAQQMIDRGDLRGAQLELRNAVRLDPQNSSAHYRLGVVQLRLGDPVAAEKELKTARDQGFDTRATNLPMAQAYMQQSKFKEMLRDFPVQGLPPDQAAPILVLRSLAQLSLDDQTAATASAAEAERLMPQFPDAAIASARAAIARRDFPGAEQKTDRALQINPRSTDAMVLKGQLLNVKGDRTRALESFDAALALNPNLVAARLERANILVITGQDARAREDVQAVLAIEPRSAMATYLQGVLQVKAEDYAGADASLTKLGPTLTRFPRGLLYQAIAKYNLGQAEQASEAATKFLARNPDDPDAVKLFARVELAGRRTAKAIEVLSKAASSGNADADTLDLLGRAYALAGKPEQAVQSMERAVALAPGNADILTRLASIRMNTGDSAHAAGDLEKVLQMAPEQAGAAEALVVAAISSGEIDRAAVALERVRKAQGDSETVGNLAALIKMAQLDMAGAEALLNDTIKRFPDAIQPRINLAKVLVAEDRAPEAQAVLAEVLKRQPTQPLALASMVALLRRQGKAAEAVTLVENAHAAAPKDDELTIALTNLYLGTGEQRKALAQLDVLLKDQPANVTLLAAKARVQGVLGMPAEAQATWRSVLEAAPANTDARRTLADLLVATQDNDGAKAVLAEGLKLDPGNQALMQTYLQIVFRTAGLDAALALGDQLARDPKNLPAASWLKGDAYMLAGRFVDAATLYAAELRPESSTTLVLRLVRALNATGRSEQASQTLRDWLAAHPDDDVAAEALASLDLVARRFLDAETHLQAVLRKRPSDAGALNNLAWVYQQRNDARARILAQKAFLVAPTPQAADTLGWILVTSGDAGTGLPLLRQAATQLGNDPSIQYHLAVALKETGRKDDAIRVLKPIVDGFASFEERQAATRMLEDLSKG